MKYTYQMRKYFSITAAAFLSGIMLFGCTRSDVASSSQNAAGGTSGGQGVVSSTAGDQSLAGAGSGKTAEAGSQQAESTASSGSQSAPTVEGQTAQNVTGTTTQSAAPQSSGQNTQNAQNSAQQTNAGTTRPQAQTPDNQADFVDGPDAEESFGGEFEKSDGEESVVITLVNDSQISFQFQTSGIGAMAQASGTTAVYQGDDGYTVSFDVAGDMLAVTVSGEGGEESLMNGIYYRVVDGGGNTAYADDAGTDYDADEEMEEDFDAEQTVDEDEEDVDPEADEASW